jgi:hypothetical protein
MTINWRSVVRQSVHVPSTSSSIPTSFQLNSRVVANIPTPLPNLWVENGVIWQLPSLLIGFTSYSAVTKFTASLNGTGMGAPPSKWYQGKPFSERDFPILYDQWQYSQSKKIKPTKSDSYATKSTTVWGACDCLIWPSLAALPQINMFMSMLGSQAVTPTHGHAKSAGPVVPVSAITNFSANSPSGTATFSAQYVMYVPGGIASKTSYSGIQYDMSTFSWTRKWIVRQYDSGGKSSGSGGSGGSGGDEGGC